MKEGETPDLRQKIRARFNDAPDDLLLAAISIYVEIVKWHERSVRLTVAEFAAAKQDLEFLRKIVIFLLASDLASGERVPILCHLWLIDEQGGGHGWARMKLKMLKNGLPPRE